MDWFSIENLQKLLTESYGIKIYDYEPMKKVLKLTTDQGIKVLKKVNTSYDRFLFIQEAITHARNKGFLNIPPTFPTYEGKLGLEFDGGILMMSQWIPSREANYEDILELELATVALAQFHQAAEKFQPSQQSKARALWGKWIENFERRCREMLMFQEIAKAKEIKTSFDEQILTYTDYFYDWGVKSIGHLKNSSYYQLAEESKKNRTFCHHDMAYHNVLLTEENDVYLIDFDYCILDMHLHDLTSLMIRNLRYGHWDMEKGYFIFNTYNKEKEIKGEEIGVMKAFMEFPQEFWQVGLQYYVEKQPWQEEVFHRRLERVLDDIPKREVFMKKFLV